jgi:iron complex transport system substrate-binding protein
LSGSRIARAAWPALAALAMVAVGAMAIATASRARASSTEALVAPPPAPKAPQRVVSLNLSADEVLAEILPPGRLVAVTRWADDPGSSNVVGRVPSSVVRLPRTDMERLLELRPDLVVVSEYTDADFLQLLWRSGLRHHRMRGLGSVAGVRQAILDLGGAVGEPAAAERLVARYDATLAELRGLLAGAPRPRVLYWSSGMTAGADTAIGSLIETAGARNLGRELGVVGIQPPGAERAFVSDPDVILVGSWDRAAESVREDPLLGRLRAVREGHIVVMPNRLLVALSQFTADACWELAALLHPERVRPRK